MAGNRRPGARPEDKVARAHAQAARARKMAAECGSALIADLFNVHAAMCDRNAGIPPDRRWKLNVVKSS
jgi:hypothetical protein